MFKYLKLIYYFLFQVALTVLEAHIKICRDMYSGNILTEGVKQVTAVMYTPAPEKVGGGSWVGVGWLTLDWISVSK